MTIDLFKTACDITRAHAADLGVVLPDPRLIQHLADTFGQTPEPFYHNECSRYHAAIQFKGNRCPACKALAQMEVLEDRLDDCHDRMEDAIDAKLDAEERLNEISRRRI